MLPSFIYFDLMITAEVADKIVFVQNKYVIVFISVYQGDQFITMFKIVDYAYRFNGLDLKYKDTGIYIRRR